MLPTPRIPTPTPSSPPALIALACLLAACGTSHDGDPGVGLGPASGDWTLSRGLGPAPEGCLNEISLGASATLSAPPEAILWTLTLGLTLGDDALQGAVLTCSYEDADFPVTLDEDLAGLDIATIAIPCIGAAQEGIAPVDGLDAVFVLALRAESLVTQQVIDGRTPEHLHGAAWDYGYVMATLSRDDCVGTECAEAWAALGASPSDDTLCYGGAPLAGRWDGCDEFDCYILGEAPSTGDTPAP